LDRTGQLPATDHQAVADILRRPDFVRTNDANADLNRAYAVVGKLRQQEAALSGYIEQQLRQMDPAVAREVQSVITSDPSFRAMLAAQAPGQFGDMTKAYSNFSVAIGYAQKSLAEKRQKQKALVRAMGARPTKSSSGRLVESAGGGLDGAISRALNKQHL
jgi:hypothetical protein